MPYNTIHRGAYYVTLTLYQRAVDLILWSSLRLQFVVMLHLILRIVRCSQFLSVLSPQKTQQLVDYNMYSDGLNERRRHEANMGWIIL